MGIAADLRNRVREIIGDTWSITDGKKIPTDDDIGLGNVGTRIELVVLYADLAGSTNLVRDYKDWFAAEVCKAFLVCCVRIIRDHGGVITSFDGDRVMAVFHGGSKNTNAAKVALKINHAVTQIIVPRIHETYPKQSDFRLRHCVGVDRSELLVTRSGIRGNNDLVWIGQAANYAAILSDQRDGPASYITSEVYEYLQDEAKYGKNGERMWIQRTVTLAGRSVSCYASTWRWEP